MAGLGVWILHLAKPCGGRSCWDGLKTEALISPASPGRRRGWSLVAKLVLFGSVLVAGTVGLFAWIWWSAEKAQAEREWRGSLEHEARLAAVRVQAFVAETGHDAIFLAATPSVRERSRSTSR